MARLMGFGGFGSTKGKEVADNREAPRRVKKNQNQSGSAAREPARRLQPASGRARHGFPYATTLDPRTSVLDEVVADGDRSSARGRPRS